MLWSDRIHKIYFLGIGGIAMSSVAIATAQSGYIVAGSDSGIYPPSSELLQNAGIPIYQGYSEENIQNFQPDLVIVGNGIVRSNPEVDFLLEKKIPFLSLPEYIRWRVIQQNCPIVVTGTHGKTTTSSLIAWIFDVAGLKPGYVIGGLPGNFPVGARFPEKSTNKYVVLEGDEYDSAFFDKRSKFLHYFPHHLIINNIEFDHADIFSSIEDIFRQFRLLFRLLSRNSVLYFNCDSKNVLTLVEGADIPTTKIITYGFSDAADVQIIPRSVNRQGSEIELRYRGFCETHVYRVPLLGRGNLYNCVAAILVSTNVGIQHDVIQDALLRFRLPHRRMEKIGEYRDGIAVYQDFAHHPTAMQLTLEAFRLLYPDRRIVVFVEPRSNTLVRNIFQERLKTALLDASILFFAPPYRFAHYDHKHLLDVHSLASHYTQVRHIPAYVPPRELWDSGWQDWIVQKLESLLQPGDVLVFFTNGSFQGLIEKVVTMLLNNGKNT